MLIATPQMSMYIVSSVMLKRLRSRGSFNSISDRVHFVRHDALAGCAHRNARRSPVVDGIG